MVFEPMSGSTPNLNPSFGIRIQFVRQRFNPTLEMNKCIEIELKNFCDIQSPM